MAAWYDTAMEQIKNILQRQVVGTGLVEQANKALALELAVGVLEEVLGWYGAEVKPLFIKDNKLWLQVESPNLMTVIKLHRQQLLGRLNSAIVAKRLKGLNIKDLVVRLG